MTRKNASSRVLIFLICRVQHWKCYIAQFSWSLASEMNFFITSKYIQFNVLQYHCRGDSLHCKCSRNNVIMGPFHSSISENKMTNKLVRCSFYNVRRSPHAWNFFSKLALGKSTGSSPVNATQEVVVSEILVIMQISKIASCVLIANDVQKTRVCLLASINAGLIV